ncbi:MAG: nuclear transport factor 2 family protein [Cyanobacteria bacterium J083]|nr:MAG: nuclear transport factor 2 family protein [Cyanobacteria bacterium J083]
MTETIKNQILQGEERLRKAMLTSDINVLDELLAPKIIITTHLGELLGKEDDLSAHASGAFKIHELIPSQQKIQIYENMAIASVRMQLSGEYNGNLAQGDFRYTRVWSMSALGNWQIVAAHISMVT